MRGIIFAVLCGSLVLFQSHASGSLASTPSKEIDGDLVKPPPDPALVVVEQLGKPGLTAEQTVGLVESLGTYRSSPVAARTLITWINYSPPWCDRRGGARFEPTAPRALDRPAVRGLIHLGEFAAPFLVEADFRIYASYRESPILRIHPERVFLHFVAKYEPKVSQRTVEVALQQMATNPANETVQAASKAFITAIVSAYPEPERAKLFPAAALKL